MAPIWRVGSYFINVGLGDGAIHLLLDESITPKWKQIKSAILIDGGLRGDDQIEKCIHKILNDYGYPTSTVEDFKLTAVVVTHWDRDHYEATMTMIQANFHSAKYASCKWIGPDTIFYLPSTKLGKSAKDSAPMVYAVENITKKGAELWIKKKDGKKGEKVKLCRAIVGTVCLGRDLFSGEVIGTSENLNEILKKAEAKPKLKSLLERPLFLCVGIDYQLLSGDSYSQSSSTVTNASSMMCVLLKWETTSQSIDLQLYTGGDAEDPQEQCLQEWLVDSGVEKINVFKCGHHGSGNATHSAFFDLKPEYFIMSVGEEYGHPSLSLLFFIIAYYGHREQFGSKQRIHSTRYPYWLLHTGVADALDKRELNIEKMLDKDYQYYHAELKRLNPLKSDQDAIIDIYFPKFGAKLKAIADVMTKEEQQRHTKLWKKIYEFRNLQISDMDTKTATDWDDLTKKDEHKQKLWGELQNSVINKVRAFWPGFGVPLCPVNTTAHSREYEVRWVYVKFFDDSAPVPKTLHYTAHQGVNINTTYYMSASSQMYQAQLQANNPLMDTLKKMNKKLEEKALKKNNKRAAQLKYEDELRKEAKLNTFSLMAQASELSIQVSMNQVEEDAFIWEFLTHGLPLASVPPMSRTTFNVASVTAGSLNWLKASIQAEAVELTTVSGVSPPIINSFAIHSRHLKFSSSCEALKSQFGDSIVEKINSRGYHSDLEAVLLALDIKDTVALTLTEFTDLIGFGLGGVSGWILELIGGLPLEIRAPNSTDPSVPVDEKHLPRCGVWVQPQFDNRTILRLQSVIPASHEKVRGFMNFIQNSLEASEVSEFQVIGSVRSTLSAPPVEIAEHTGIASQVMVIKESQLSFVGSLHWAKSNSRVNFAVSLTSDSSVSLFLQPPKNFSLKEIVGWIVLRFGASMSEKDRPDGGSTEEGFTKLLDKLAKSIIPRQLSVTIRDGTHLTAFQIDVELQLHLGADNEHVPIHGQVKWEPGRLELLGEIWELEDQSLVPFSVHPYRELFSEVLPETTGAINYIWLPHLFDGDAKREDFPKAIPLELHDAHVQLTLGDWKKLVIKGSLQCGAPKTGDPVMPAIWLDELSLLYMKDISADTTTFELRGNINLRAPDYILSAKRSASVRVYIGYNQGWTLSTEAVDLQVANFYSIFPIDGSNHALMNLMADIWVPSLSITVKFAEQRTKSLEVDGIFIVGPLEMNLEYKHDSKGWHFGGGFRSAINDKQDATLGEMLDDLIHDHLDSFPDFIRHLKIPLSKISASLTCSSKTLAGSTTKHVVFSFSVTVDKFSFTFVQTQDKRGAFPGQKDEHKKKPRRILRFSLAGLPKAKDIPVVQDLPQPFDEMEFLWVSEDVTMEEAKLINQEVFKDQSPPLLWTSKTKKSGSEDESKAIALHSGFHFQLILREGNQPTCALDYVFGKPTKAVSQQKPGKGGTPADPSSQPTPPAPAGSAALTPVTRSSNGLAVRNMGLKMKDKKTLTITLDAVVNLGPLAFSMIGFQVNLNFEKFKTPSDITKLDVTFDLNGMAVAFSRPPTTLAGMFAREVSGGTKTYSGGLAIGFGAWEFLAAGVYEEHDDFKSVFVFAKLNGPIISFGFAEVNGLVGGFGYNSFLRWPTSSAEVASFPFVDINRGSTKPAADVTAQYAALTSTKGDKAWFKSQRDAIWLAAGLGVKAFQMLDVQAVVCVDLSPNPKVGIFAEAIASLPKGVGEDKAYLYLDITFGATFDPGVGILSLTGELTPRSFLFSKDCKLSGGFALVYFLPASGHDGDWVFTAGGYHPAFKIPSHYPRDVKRVGIAWSYDNEISISGEAYFAITPQAIMGGGRLDLIYQSGHTRASFSAYADLLIFYEPFQFQARVGVNVFASARIGVGFLSKDVSSEISADVDLHGPPVAGVAHLHFWFFTISVRFGPDHQERAPLDWFQFYALVKQSVTYNEAKYLPEHIVNALQGRVSTDAKQSIAPHPNKGEKPPAEPWLVRAPIFEFEIMARFPIREVRYNNKPADEGVKARAREIYSTPMKRPDPFSKSELVVTIRDSVQNIDADFQLEPIVKRVPGALWNKYDPNKSLLESDSTVDHVMGIKFKPVTAHESDEKLPPIRMSEFHTHHIGGKDLEFRRTEYAQVGNASRANESPQLDLVATKANRQVVIELWENLRHHTTGGGPLYRT
ncbi:hypothetical protein F5Y14DRAFT_415138 [Nemania sp. NC0429]|nr:hypothetical protein F5Y14DRAFT_415138 [Nemania sp. NC0429]